MTKKSAKAGLAGALLAVAAGGFTLIGDGSRPAQSGPECFYSSGVDWRCEYPDKTVGFSAPPDLAPARFAERRIPLCSVRVASPCISLDPDGQPIGPVFSSGG